MAKRGKRRQNSILGLAVVIIMALVGGGAHLLNSGGSQNAAPAGTTATVGQTQTRSEKEEYAYLAKLDYQNNSEPVLELAKNKSGLDAATWNGPRIVYGDLDQLNRTTTNIGYLNRQTLIKSAGRPRQDWQPTGWHNRTSYVDGKQVNRQNRGHLIAYTLSGNLNNDGQYAQGNLGSSDNPKNLASQTEYANQVLMQPFEQQARDAIASGEKLIYKVTTVFRGSELMPRGYWLRALTTDGDLDFNVYIFNVQNGIRYDYATGRSVVDNKVVVKEEE
ncbi:DNA/RNA non-specific endonuclease [Lacticaseibacillus mingshuiensis]|uniref:DNA/RNA non-specific endonuclease n=1 Tax=Lacticaseibacillus mingshuiensis TaxID=2799574 RepID=UPI0019426539|nr:DNA/RNA non-specific endonuclease [Lacticaseibacillus mingshuiensis]